MRPRILDLLVEQLDLVSDPCTAQLLACGEENVSKLRAAVHPNAWDSANTTTAEQLSQLIDVAYESMKGSAGALCWRRLYTDASVFLALHKIHVSSPPEPLAAIAALDKAIIIAGAAGDGRLDLIHHLIADCQSNHAQHITPLTQSRLGGSTKFIKLKLCQDGSHTALRADPRFCSSPSSSSAPGSSSSCSYPAVALSSSTHEAPTLLSPPSVSSFRHTHSKRPFVLRGYASHWPALQQDSDVDSDHDETRCHSWNSVDYLCSVAGPGRTVPVEIGSDYTTEEWTHELMAWDEFISRICCHSSASSSSSLPLPSRESHSDRQHSPAPTPTDINDCDHNSDGTRTEDSRVLYLAQHDLLKQFPSLRDDIIIPDYVYACPPAPEDYPSYRPPGNEDELVVNVWLGPGGTVSPAHTDPFYNVYVQVAGYKTVWLAPPSVSAFMNPYSPSSASPSSASTADTDSGSSTHNNTHTHPATNSLNPMMSNTSRFDVFSSPQKDINDESSDSEFWDQIVPEASHVTLGPGDMLFFPPGWWHAMRSETCSFSVSMWF